MKHDDECQLLIRVLPAYVSVAEFLVRCQEAESFAREDVEVLTYRSNLSYELLRLQAWLSNYEGQEQTQLKKVLTVLERRLGEPLLELPTQRLWSWGTSYRALQALGRKLDSRDGHLDPASLKDILRLDSREKKNRSRIIKCLKDCNAAFERSLERQCPTFVNTAENDSVKYGGSSTHSAVASISKLANHAHEGLSRQFQACQRSHSSAHTHNFAKLGLAAFKSPSLSLVKEAKFDLLFPTSDQDQAWQEAEVRVSSTGEATDYDLEISEDEIPHKREPKVAFAADTKPQDPAIATWREKGWRVKSICEEIDRDSTRDACLRLLVHRTRLFVLTPGRPMHRGLTNGSVITLHEAMEERAGYFRNIGRKEKYILSFLIARSILHLYAGTWLEKGWTKRHICFPDQSDRLPVPDFRRPYLSTKLCLTERTEDELSRLRIHPDPTILALGIVLLEIALGISIESRREGQLSPNTDLLIADDLLEELRGDEDNCMPSHVDSIQTCLKPDDIFRLYKSVEDIRRSLYERIVQPLEVILGNYGISIDELHMPLTKRMPKSRRSAPIIEAQHPPRAPGFFEQAQGGFLKSMPNDGKWTLEYTHLKQTIPENPSWDKLMICGEKMARLPNTVGTFTTREAPTSREWLERLDILVDVMRARKKLVSIDDRYKRVKIAVIDTGLKPDHGKADEVKYVDFVEPNETKKRDNTTHGTVSVDLILKAYEEADLYIARVFEKDQADEKKEPYLMARAIDWAVENKVDIISISAGFQGDNDALRKAVHKAHSVNILIFAAASNWGNLDDVAYPARIKDHVFCIFSTNGQLKNTSEFNPEPRGEADNFAVLGEDIDVYPGSGKPLVRGTSTATALAAGLAARILDFARHTDCCDGIQRVELIGTKAGMRTIFRAMTRRTWKYDCIGPWLLLKANYKEQSVQQNRTDVRKKISQALQTVD